MTIFKTNFIFLSALAAFLPAAAMAQPVVRTGELICNVAGGTGMILMSEKALTCRYDALGGRLEFYTGTIKKFGLDLGTTTGGGMMWTVFEPAVKPGGLAGNYAGVTAEATLGVGAGANALVGGGNGGVTLQPLSIQGQTGVNLAVGVGSLTLTEITPPPAPRMRHRSRAHHAHRYHHRG